MNYTNKNYLSLINKNLVNKFNYINIHQIPKLEKITISSGLGLKAQKLSLLKKEVEDLRIISGQHPLQTKARQSISEFGIRKGMILGLLVTLRRKKMYLFLEKLIKLYLPQLRDFKGLELKHFDKSGNYHLGIKDKNIFPELNSNLNIDNGYTISIVIKSNNIKESFYLLKQFNFPFKEKEYNL
jgi:large subunit ribosomal protein L5